MTFPPVAAWLMYLPIAFALSVGSKYNPCACYKGKDKSIIEFS